MTSQEPIHRIRQNQQEALARGAKHIGDVIAYDATALSVKRTQLRAIFEGFGAEKYAPAEIEPKSAVSRAAGRPMEKGLFAKAFQEVGSDAVYAVGIYEQRQGSGETGDKMICGARVRVEKGGRIVALPPEGADAIPACLEQAERIAAAAIQLVHYAETTDVTNAVVAFVSEKLRGVAMRRRGGIYFIRPDHSTTWQALAKALAHYGFRDLSYPMVAMPDDQRAIGAAAHMVKVSLEADLADLRTQLADLDKKTKDKTIEHRVADCEALVSKAELYQEILGGWVDELRQAAEKTRQAFQARDSSEADELYAPLGGEEG